MREDSYCPFVTPGDVAAAEHTAVLEAAARADQTWTIECRDPHGRLEWRRSNRRELVVDRCLHESDRAGEPGDCTLVKSCLERVRLWNPHTQVVSKLSVFHGADGL